MPIEVFEQAVFRRRRGAYASYPAIKATRRRTRPTEVCYEPAALNPSRHARSIAASTRATMPRAAAGEAELAHQQWYQCGIRGP